MSDGLEAPKTYAHKGRRRRKITDELFRCPLGINFDGRGPVGEGVLCHALLWRSDVDTLRKHLVDDHGITDANNKADSEVSRVFIPANTISQPDITDDPDSPEEPGESDGVSDY